MQRDRNPGAWLVGIENGAGAVGSSVTVPQYIKHRICI